MNRTTASRRARQPGPRLTQHPPSRTVAYPRARMMTGRTVAMRPVGYAQPAGMHTVYRPRVLPAPAVPAARPPLRPVQPAARSRAARPKAGLNWPLFALLVPGVMLTLAAVLLALGGLMLLVGGRTLPGVSMLGVDIGGRTEAEAAAALETAWSSRGITLLDSTPQGDRLFPIDPVQLGITLDARASAQRAVQYGRGAGGIGGLLKALIGRADVPPEIDINLAVTEQGLRAALEQLEQPPVNAGVQFVNGALRERPAQAGRALNLDATLAPLTRDAAAALADGVLDLEMLPVQPAVTDASGLLSAANALLASPLVINAYDPIRNQTLTWSAPPEQWANWLVAAPQSSALGLSLDADALQTYFEAHHGELGAERYLKMDESLRAAQAAVVSGQTTAQIRVYYRDRQHTVQPGETIISIAYDYGIPYPWLEGANPGVNSLSVGQTITVPSPDNMLPYDVIPGKRIVVSMPEQRVRVYENGALKWDWPTSTGIQDSPTWPGIYQIISHEPNAYAGNWNLWMPHFMGVYQPIPGADFTNGFHGFPTRDGYQLLWTNSLGTRVTYGCILLSNVNAEALYAWAEEGVVVEIQG